MKKLIYYSIFLLLILNFVTCKKEKQITTDKKEVTQNYIVDVKNSVINWTAYKTTDKIPVKGIFEKVKINSSAPAASPLKALNGTTFEIPVSSIFSKDSIRDFKLVNYFFGVMKNTLNLTGEINLKENGEGIVTLNMNGITKDLPVNYKVENDLISLNTSMNLDNWQAQAAIESLNVVCNEKHKAADGISKTWSEVTLNIQVKTMLK